MRRTISTAFAAVGAAVVVITVGARGADSSAQVPTGEDLKGTWAQSGAGYEKGTSVIWENQTVVIEEADGQGFAGHKEYTPPQKENVNGVVGPDGSVLIVDEDGTFQGRLVDGKLQGQYAGVGGDAAAINVELARK